MRIPALPRVVAPETLDALAADDPRAVRSRRDLRRVNRVIGARAIVVRALRSLAARRARTRPMRILELGCGDGDLMLGVARDLGPAASPAELTLLDRQALVSAATIDAYRDLGWTARSRVVDVLEWIAPDRSAGEPADAADRYDLVVTNLFLHHFRAAELTRLCGAIAPRCDAFFACEPRRARLALAGSHLIGALGVNAVTREDAVLSVHAGFRARELTALWPARAGDWQVHEYSAGLFSQCLRAERVEAR